VTGSRYFLDNFSATANRAGKGDRLADNHVRLLKE
jgi:hypothetical protein